LKELTDVRDQMIAHIDEIIGYEKKNKQFLASSSIGPLLSFLFKLIRDTKPQVGFADQIIERLLLCPLLYIDELFCFAPFASKPKKERILSYLVKNGFVNHVEQVLVLIGRKPTEEEIKTIARNNFGSYGKDSLFQKSLELVDKYYPHLRNLLIEEQKKWEKDD
jgi:hypothetical protein